MFTGGNESLREQKGLWPRFTRKSSNHLENTYMYIHRSQLCLWCGLEMRIFKNKILEKIFFINHTIQSFNEYLTQAPNTACCQFFSAQTQVCPCAKLILTTFTFLSSPFMQIYLKMASQPLVTSCSLPDHSPRSVSWQVLSKQLGVLHRLSLE